VSDFATKALDMPYSAAATILMIVNGVGLPARIPPAILADKIGPLNVLIPLVGCVFVVASTWLAVKDSAGYYAFAVFYAILIAAFQCLIPTSVASITKRLDMVGTRLGMFFSIVSIASLTGPPLGGALQNAAGGRFYGAQIWSALSLLVGFCFLCTARYCKAGLDLKAWV